MPEGSPRPLDPLIERAPEKPLRAKASPSPDEDAGSSWALWIVLVTLAAAAAGGGYLYYQHGKNAGPASGGRAQGPVPVVVATARRGDLDLFLTGLGSVTAFNSVTVRSRVDGELMDVAFTEGQLVNQGDVIAAIDSRPYLVQLATAEGQLQKDTADHKNAETNLSRYREARDTLSEQVIDTQVALVAQTEAAMAIDQAAISNAKLQLTYCRITAPITGRIGLRLVDKGNIVRAADPSSSGLALITQLRPIAVVFALPQDDLAKVIGKPRSGEGLGVVCFDRDLKKKLASGKLLTFDNQIDPQTGTVRFKAVFENADGALFPNQFVNARLLLDTRKDAILVPTAAVQRSPSSTFVYVVKPGKTGEGEKPGETVELRDVVTGPTEGDETVIESGLAQGEAVVIEGVDKLVSGAAVTVPEAKRSKPGEAKPGKGEAKPEKTGEARSP